MIINFSTAVAARTLWGEARGEPLIGQTAVAWVLRNRLYSGKWGHTLASVCLWPSQFSCWNADDPNRIKMCELVDSGPELQTLAALLDDVMNAKCAADPTEGATYYFNPNSALPYWASEFQYVGTFGSQKFYREGEK